MTLYMFAFKLKRDPQLVKTSFNNKVNVRQLHGGSVSSLLVFSVPGISGVLFFRHRPQTCDVKTSFPR